MNDPHVNALRYRLDESDFLGFEAPPDLEFDTPDFSGRLSAGLLILKPKGHFATEYEVKPLADEFVHAWEIDASLRYGHMGFQFRFQGAEVIDRNPSPSAISISVSHEVSMSTNAHLKIISPAYPDPPEQFSVTPEVEVLYNRLCNYWAGRELLLSMAYFCLTLLERGDRRLAAKQFGIAEEVLRKLGELASTRGDEVVARKRTSQMIPLTQQEKAWLEGAIKAIISHLATRRPGVTLKMPDLPPLP